LEPSQPRPLWKCGHDHTGGYISLQILGKVVRYFVCFFRENQDQGRSCGDAELGLSTMKNFPTTKAGQGRKGAACEVRVLEAGTHLRRGLVSPPLGAPSTQGLEMRILTWPGWFLLFKICWAKDVRDSLFLGM
jgi:hypothetical protein